MDDRPTPPSRRLRDPRWWLLGLAVLCVLGVLVLRLWLKWVGPLPGDRWAQFHVKSIDGEQPWQDLGTFFSIIGGPTVASITGVVALWFAWRAGGFRAALFVAVACLGVLANMVLKVVSGQTPLMVEKAGGATSAFTSLNYPSGHTVYGVALFGSLAWLSWGNGRRDVSVVLILLVAAMGPARVVADAHFVSDVVAGYLAGFAWLIGAALLTGAGGASPRLQVGQLFPRT